MLPLPCEVTRCLRLGERSAKLLDDEDLNLLTTTEEFDETHIVPVVIIADTADLRLQFQVL